MAARAAARDADLSVGQDKRRIALDQSRAGHLARHRQGRCAGALSPDRRHALDRRRGRAAQSERSRRHARDGSRSWRRWPRKAAARCIGWPTACRDSAASTRAARHAGSDWIGLAANSAYARDERGRNAAAAGVAGTAAVARHADSGVANRRTLSPAPSAQLGSSIWARRTSPARVEQHIRLQRLAQDARLIDRSGKADAPRRIVAKPTRA